MSPNVIEPRAASQGIKLLGISQLLTKMTKRIIIGSRSLARHKPHPGATPRVIDCAAENSADLGMSAGGETQKISLNVIEFHEEHMMIYKNVMITFDKYTIYIYM